ncbi:unnamed protein product [Heligmosomoides polygyrus]|uniref:AraC family transcriptional regulator n=1 Tax=Heligmosomoides polygyrus TaxID=6339 RepID=A0A183G8Z3_HELPZ|nr:unnamed protein product [Heligmosomoides polygyrus]
MPEFFAERTSSSRTPPVGIHQIGFLGTAFDQARLGPSLQACSRLAAGLPASRKTVTTWASQHDLARPAQAVSQSVAIFAAPEPYGLLLLHDGDSMERLPPFLCKEFLQLLGRTADFFLESRSIRKPLDLALRTLDLRSVIS